ncbi:MAG: glycoside hydrolase family 3 C-terminal domain-containing protein [Melioribacteraceae bacterium]|nr:glycoside hydrolase family 3 C-terminal domain-containing protein [Melioribacteraceae bacterium]MCF8262968.1 glycoside hydrolase family 3 C-terminal domain-containing protein [Melioribacteraceae bacterium]MCF8430599.1 glycoside hydrolase family 3 C-terminal domain-containing protein [Melioribacteraceae bacterium]
MGFLQRLFFTVIAFSSITILAQSDDGIEAEIHSLLSKMTIEEKIGQTSLRGTSSRVDGSLSDELKSAVREGRIGAFLNVMNTDYVKELQKIAVEESPNKIPLLFGRDVIHGFKTIFPIPLGIAATWNKDVAKSGARISALEASSVGIRWTFAPMLDISRDARWGRIAESPGEDPFLASVLAKAYIEGFQGEDLKSSTSMAASIKHFIGYGAAIGGRDYNTVIIHNALLHNVYLPPFKTAIDAGALTLMTAFNEINGIPATGNKFLLKDLLRDELGFNGFIVSDWASVTEMIAHGYARDYEHAAELSIKSGMDMEMSTHAYENSIQKLMDKNLISEKELDFLVANILRVKLKMGLFEKPSFPSNEQNVFYKTEYLEAAKNAAIESFVLLKNEDVLPLSSNQTFAVIGPLADAPHEQLGTWTFDGDKEKTITPVDAFQNSSIDFMFAQGLTYSRDKSTELFEEAISAAENSDVILFFGGEESILSGEAHSRANIDLPGAQEELISKLAETGKPIVLVIMAGRPISIMNIIDKVDAVLMAWHPGTMGGPALFDVLAGISEPGGRLPVTWPKDGAQSPIYYNHKNTGRPADQFNYTNIDDIPIGAWQSSIGNRSHYLDLGYKPHFPFGYGLTYTDFEYSDISISSKSIQVNESVEISAKVKNIGSRKGREVVQLYVQDVVASITRPVKELKGFEIITLNPGEEKTIKFTINPKDLSFVTFNDERVLEPGKFNVWIGPNSSSGINSSFELK